MYQYDDDDDDDDDDDENNTGGASSVWLKEIADILTYSCTAWVGQLACWIIVYTS